MSKEFKIHDFECLQSTLLHVIVVVISNYRLSRSHAVLQEKVHERMENATKAVLML